MKEQEVVQELKKKDGQAWEENRIVYIDGQIYIPNNKKIWEQVLWENHNHINVGYLGQIKMLELIKRNYWWLGIKEDVKKYVQECIKC